MSLSKLLLRSLLCLSLIAVIAITALPSTSASAATTVTKTYTETQINNSYRITHPLRWRVTNLRVDLKPGYALVTATHEYRTGKTVTTNTTFVPILSNGRLTWNVISFTYNDKAVSQDVINQINNSINSAWRNWFKTKLPAGKLTSVTITDVDISFVAVR
ncbi:MAG: hypothetical protein U0528_01010 [Anaerolineae bacterium]